MSDSTGGYPSATQENENDRVSQENDNDEDPISNSMTSYYSSLSEITDDGRLERAISTSCWVENLMENLMKDKKAAKAERVSFHPLQSTVTYDAEKITPEESIVYVKSRSKDADAADFIKSSEYDECTNVGTLVVTSLRAASEIMNFIASTSFLQLTMYSSRNLIPLFLSTSKQDEFGGRAIKQIMMKKCFSREVAVDSLLEELNSRKINAAKAFAHAVREKSIVNMALAAWVAGNAANLQHLVQFSKLKYGPQRMYKNAGMFRATATTIYKNKSITSTEYMEEIKKRHKGTLNFDSAPSIFNSALARVFSEFKAAVSSDNDINNPLSSAVRQNRHAGVKKGGGFDNMGMLAPRTKHSVADYMVAERDAESLEQILTKVSTDFENLRGGRKRKADTEVSDLRDTLAQSIANSAVDPSKVKTSADLIINDGNWEWSMHITQLFSQAFLEAMSSLLSCSFGVKNPFSDEGLKTIGDVIRKRDDNRNVNMNPSVLADEYLLFTGNFQIPFHVSDPRDIVEGRQVCPNTPILTIVTRYNTAGKGTVTDIELRDRLLVKDELLNGAITATNSTPSANRNTPTDIGAEKKPMLGGCLPVIRGPLVFNRGTTQGVSVDDIVNSLANDWYISTGVYYSVGKTSAAICAGYQRAIASTNALYPSSSSSKNKRNKGEEKKMKRSMRGNADRSARLLALLGQAVSEWGHQEHNSSLDSFWSSSAAVRSKAAQDALSRSEIIGVRKQLDGKCSGDQLRMAEQHIRNTFYNNISHAASYDIDAIVNFSDGYSKYSEWFQNDASGIAQKSWEQYVASMANLSEYERRAFNVRGLFSAIDMFKFPLVSPKTAKPLNSGHKRTNLKAIDRIINGLTEMVIQSAFNGTSTAEISMGLGSAADGWGLASNQLEPSRIKALKLMTKFGRRRPDVISIPVSRSRGSISGLDAGITSVDIPAVIMSHLISDKKILDDLCGERMDLGKEITNFVQTLSERGEGGTTTKNSIFTTGKHSIMLLRYIWFNTAIISLTDTNIKMAVNVVKGGLGDALYCDYLSIRSLVNNYNRSLCNFSINAVSKHYLNKNENSNKNITIKSDADLMGVLQQTTDVLSAFTDKTDGISANSTNMKKVIKRIDNVKQVKDTLVVIQNLSKILSVENLKDLLIFLYDIGKLNANIEEPLRRLALGKGLTKTELDNYVHPDITKLFQRELQGTATNSSLGTKREITIDLNTEVPAIIKVNAEYVRERLAALNAIPANSRDSAVTEELENLGVELAQTHLPALKNTINVPGFLTPAVAIQVVNAFTRDGRSSNSSTHMGIMMGAILKIKKLLDANTTHDTLSITVDNVSQLVQNILLFCFICAHSLAGPILITHGIKDLSRLLSDIVAETSLSVSRLQSSFYPLPPSVFSLSGMFKPDKNLFDDMAKEYVAEIVKSLTTATSNSMTERCNDELSSSKLFQAGENLNKDNTPVGQQSQEAQTSISLSLKNPASVWSSCALPHFDVAVVPKFQSGITSDQLFRLSTYYQGMHKMSLNPDCKPHTWDTTLAGNKAGTFFGLGDISDNNRSFNSALDTIIASPVEICDLVSRETVRNSNDVVHNIGSFANVDKIQKMLHLGASVVKPLNSSSTDSPIKASIKETISALSKNNYSSTEGYDTAKEIVKTWNTLSLVNHSGEVFTGNNKKQRDVVTAPLVAVPAFRHNVVEATKSVYELAAVCSVMSKDESVRAASRKIMGTVEYTSPVIQDIGIGRVAGLVSTVASPRQYRKFLNIVSDYRNYLVRLVNVNPFSTTSSSSAAAAAASGENGLKAVYDGMLYAASSKSSSTGFSSSSLSSLSDQFWMGVFNECLETTNLFADKITPASYYSASAPSKIYGSRVNTYAAISNNIDRLKVSMNSMDKDRREKVKKSMAEIEKYISELASDKEPRSMLIKLIDAQHMYTKLSDITANSVYSDCSNVTCGVIKNTVRRSKSARRQSDAILSAMLHELASLIYGEKPELASQLALAGHIIVAKGVSLELNKINQIEMYNNLLSVAGVTDYAFLSANALCQRLKSDDIKMFLGGTMLQQGLFVTFLLNNVVFAQMSDSLKMDELSSATKSKLVKLVGFCKTLSDALSVRHARRRINRTTGGVAFSSEEAKVDASFASALYTAYSNLRKRSEFNDSETVAKIFGDMRFASPVVPPDALLETSVKGPRPKRNSTLADVLEAPSTIHKSFMTSFSEKSAASGQVRRAGGSMLMGNRMVNVYDSDVLNEMRASHSFFTDDCDDYCFDDFSDDEDERMSISSESSSSASDFDSDEDDMSGGGESHGYSYDALDRLNALAAPLSSIYGCGGDSDFEDENDYYHRKKENNALGSILKDVGESDGDYDSDDDENNNMPGMESENAFRRRSERIQYGPGFLSHSFLFNHPAKTRAFLTSGKKFKSSEYLAVADYYDDDDDAIFSDEYSNSDEDECGSTRHAFKRRSAEDQCAFTRRYMRAFLPTRISLVNGRVSFVTPVGTDTASGFFETYQKANKKQRENLRKKYNITAAADSSLPAEFIKGLPPAKPSPRELRRSLIKATACVTRTQYENAEKFYTAIVVEAPAAGLLANDPSVVLADTVLFSKELKGIIEKRNELLKNLTDVSSSLFTSSVGQGPGGTSNAIDRARELANKGPNNVPGYLGVPLRNLSRCLRTKAVNPEDTSNSVGISVDSMLSITDRSHLDWLTAAALVFTRSFNVTTFHAIDSTLKIADALGDMYNAFAKLVTSQDNEKVHIKSTLLDSLFSTRMSHTESVLGLVCPTAFINHEMPSDPNRRKKIESLALSVLRGVNSGQLSSIDIGDTSGLLTFLTSTKFAGRGGERGGLSLYRMSVTDALSCEPPEKRLKGAVSLEVGKRKMCDNAVFSRRSKNLVDYCSKKFLSLENAVGPVARFIPNGTKPDSVGLSKLPTMNVTDDPAMLRLESAEYGCGASGRFITASAIGNLYGRIDDILNLAKKFVISDAMFTSANTSTSIKEIAKDIISKMKARRNKSLKTPFGDTVISQATNYPATSNAIVLRAKEMRSSITTIVSDISKRHGIPLSNNFMSCKSPNNGTKVSVKTFEHILETSAVLANTKMTLRGIENRLAAAYTNLKQFKHIANEGMSESRAVISAVAETMNTLDYSEQGERVTVAGYMNEDNLFRFIVNTELKNIEDAKRQITSAIEGACQLHAKMLSMLASAADINSNSEECQRLKNLNESLTSVVPMTSSSNCGMFIKHPNTGMWLKTDEECNTANKNNDDYDDHRRVAYSILSIIENNRNKALRSKLHTMCFGKYSVSDIFVMDDSDVKNVDKLIEKLGAALASKVASSSATVSPFSSPPSLTATAAATTTAVAAAAVTGNAEAEDASAFCTPLAKKIPYIPIIFENRQEEKKSSSSEQKQSVDEVEEQKMALRHLETQEANDLSNILSIATKHKFVTHNQAATVAIFNGNQKAESIIPEAERKKTGAGATVVQSLMSRLPIAISAAVQATVSSGTSMQLPPSASSSSSSSTSVVLKLREYAAKVASDLISAQEYKDLVESNRKINAAIKHLNDIENKNFFTGGVRPEIEQNSMSTLSQSQSAKEGAFELFEKALKQLENYTPDPSLSTISLPVNASSSLLDNNSPSSTTSRTTDYFNYAYEKLHAANTDNKSNNDKLERDAAIKNLVEQEAAIRIPLLLSYPQFASILRDVINNFGTYYQRVEVIKQKIINDAKYAISSAFKETENEISTDKNSLSPIINELSEMYSNEADAIKTAIKVLENKMSELEFQNINTSSIIQDIANRIEAGENKVGVNDMLSYGNKADNDQQFLQNLRKFAKDNSGAVFSPSPSVAKNTNREDSRQLKIKDSYRNLLNDAVSTINAGQKGVVTDYESALGKFPSPSTSYENLTMQVAEKQQRERLDSVKMFIGALVDRISKLKIRLQNSTKEAMEVDDKKREIDNMFRRQMEDRYDDAKKNVGIAEAAAQTALVKDLSQSPLLMALSGKVDRLLHRVERIGGPLTSSTENPVSRSGLNRSDVNSRVQHIEDPTYSCFMSPFHETIKRITAMYNRDQKGPLNNDKGVPTSEADLQLMTIVDLSTSVINSTSGSKSPDMVPSSIVPGLCQLCTMVLTNLHEALHESSHSFNFEKKRSRQKLTAMLNAATSGSDNLRVRHDVLAMLEANNGYIKEFGFTHQQKVACVTPVNTLIGSFSSNITPNTVLVPTSELIHCPGVDNDKFRSMVHRSVDKTVADAPKSSASIVETLARTAPNAEKLFFPFKDQRRHFNSITDAIITNMNSEASCQLNTTCDQNLVQVDPVTGMPVFVGRRAGKSRVLETKNNSPMARGGMPGCTKDRQRFVDIETKYMVAPGSLLNANKEETLRLSRLSDINNVRHYGTDVHVAGANSAWRIGEVIKAASTCSENETTARKLLLLGSVSAVSAQKSAQYNNDPTAMLNSTFAVQNLVNEAFPSPASMAAHVGAAESAFATQLAYRHRLFPSSLNNDNYNSFSTCPVDIVKMIRRYSDAYTKVYPTPSNKSNQNCASVLKQAVSNVPLLATSIGAFEEASSAVKNRISPLFNNYFSSAVNKLSVEAMTDTVVDTLSAVSTMVGRQQQPSKIPPSVLSVATCGKPMTEKTKNSLVEAISRISRDASLVSQMNGASTFSSFLKASSSYNKPISAESDNVNDAAAERILGAILDGAREANNRLDRLGVGEGGAGRPEVGALYRNAMSSILQLNEDEITRDIDDMDMRFEKRQMREAFYELKKSMLYSNGSSSNSLTAPLSVLLSRNDAASGRLDFISNSNVINAVDEFNTTPLLVRHLILDVNKSPVQLAKEVRGILTQPKAITSHALLSESSPLLTELCLFNTRDTQPERAVDRLASSAYLVKQAKRFDGVDPLFPAALTGASHLMLSSMDSKYHSSSSFLNNIKLHMNDTTCLLKNFERYERFLGKYGDSYSMSHRQNCNCPFALHHDFRPSADEALVSSFAFARPEVSVEEIWNTPYQANKLLNDKHYVMALSKIDTRVTGSALLKKVSEWTEMRMNASFNGTFEPSRLALSNSGMTTAGVNLDVIVRPNNAKNIMGILECHRNHVCSLDAKSTIAAAMPAVFQSTSTDNPGNASELVQNALPHNRYIQKSIMNAHTVIFANVLEQLICDLGNVIVNELAGSLASSVPESVYAETKNMIDNMGSEILFGDNNNKNNMEEDYDTLSAPKLVSESMKNAIYQTLISGKAVDPKNVPFASSANGPLAYDFLLSKENSFTENDAEKGAAASVANMPTESSTKLRNHLARVFQAISKQVSDAEFGNILDDIEAKIIDESSSSSSSSSFSRTIRQEFNKILSFLKILRQNITPALLDHNGKLAEKVAVYLSLLSTKSRLENLLQYGLSNSSSYDLGHLKPINCSNNTKNIEDTFMYRNVHPVLIMALPENFTALLQQEQCDAELAVENRRSLTTFLNHPNTVSMARGARASLGAGGGNPLGLYLSSHVLHESTVTTSDPVVDADSNVSFHSSVTHDPMMVVNPFKDSAKLKIVRGETKTPVLTDNCSYLQVSMPTESSGLVTNTGVRTVTSLEDTFKFTRRDGSPVYLPKITPSVLCSDASTNLLDNFSRADVILNDVNVRFSFMPEIVYAMASIKCVNTSDIVKEMAARASCGSTAPSKNTSVDSKTGDIVVKNGTFPDIRSLENVPSNISWGKEDKQKLHARILPAFMISNPLASASVNGVPVTYEGFLLAEQKRKKAAGISTTNCEVFGSGCIGSGALKAAANSRLTSDLEPLRKGWENVIKLQATFSKAAANIRNAVEKSRNKITPETTEVVNKLHKNYQTLNQCREILQNQTSLLVATSDLVTGGYAGDPSVAMVAPVRPETTGIIGALSAPVRGLGHLLRREGVAAVNAAILEKLNLSSSNGRLIPEHGVVHKSSTELLTDADSIYRLYSINEDKFAKGDGNLGKIMTAIGLRREGGGNAVSVAKYVSNLLSPPEYGNQRDLAKRQAIVHLLVSNPDLMENVSNSLFFTAGKNSISPLTAADTSCAMIGGARGVITTNNNNSNVESLNRLFGSKLC
uniref:Wsv360-like protein n=1 Tax=Metopaulias depressus WSSV-like virus TaxID=1675544 RepID=A0A0K0VL73_9VIRU|nr:wsv360-like protein [Metopaulias depressus WSSV-like virus]